LQGLAWFGSYVCHLHNERGSIKDIADNITDLSNNRIKDIEDDMCVCVCVCVNMHT
jgi:hypothetical protein